MASGNYTATNANGVEYALTYHSGVLGLGANYDLTITYPAGGGPPKTITGIPAGNVLTTSGGTLTIASVLLGARYVIPPGVTSSVDITVALADLTPNTIYVGGTATIDSTVSVLAGLTVYVDGGSATAAGGVVAGALSGLTVDLDNGGTFSNGTALISLLNGTTINFGPKGGTFIANGGGAAINLSGLTINGFSNATDKIEFENLAAPVDHYSVSTSGSSQTITLYGADGASLGSVAVAGTTFPTGTVHQGESGPLTLSESGTTVTLDAAASVLTCFLTGTRIRTPQGDANIEALTIGDLVLTADGRALPVRWLGMSRVATRFADPLRVLPIRIAAGALGGSLPVRDLLVSPNHGVTGRFVQNCTLSRQSAGM